MYPMATCESVKQDATSFLDCMENFYALEAEAQSLHSHGRLSRRSLYLSCIKKTALLARVDRARKDQSMKKQKTKTKTTAERKNAKNETTKRKKDKDEEETTNKKTNQRKTT